MRWAFASLRRASVAIRGGGRWRSSVLVVDRAKSNESEPAVEATPTDEDASSASFLWERGLRGLGLLGLGRKD